MGKALGLLLIFCGFVLTGWGKASSLEQRARNLALWQEFLCQFRICLETTRAAPREIVRMLEKQNAFTGLSGLETMTSAFGESGSFAHAAEVLAKAAKRPGAVEQVLLSLGDTVGIKPLEEQLSALQTGASLLAREAQKARDESRRYGGLCRRMGVLLGRLAVVVLA